MFPSPLGVQGFSTTDEFLFSWGKEKFPSPLGVQGFSTLVECTIDYFVMKVSVPSRGTGFFNYLGATYLKAEEW